MDDTDRRAAHYEKMTNTPVRKLIWKLAVPTIISMMISALYNMADTFFVSKIGTSAAGAVGIVFSVQAIIQAIGFTIGMGAGNVASRLLGAKENDKASQVASSGVFAGIIISVLLSVSGTVFRPQLMSALGASSTILPYADAYACYIFIACPFMCMSFIFNNYLRAEGKAFYGMIGITTGSILNIFLDPVFIFGLSLGTAGAAMATALSQFISFLILLFMFLKGKSSLRLSYRSISFKAETYLRILTTGLPTLLRQGLASLASIALNVSAVAFGDAAVAAMSIVGRITFFQFSVMLGFGQGFQPVSSFNYGAKKYGRVYDATRYTAVCGTLLMSTVSLFVFIFAEDLMNQFVKDASVIAIGCFALRAQCLALPLTGISTTANMALQSTGHTSRASFLAFSRQGLFFIPLVIALPRAFGLYGVELAQPIADVFTFLFALVFLSSFLKELKHARQKDV